MQNILLTFILASIFITSSNATSNISPKCEAALKPALFRLNMTLKDLDNKINAKKFRDHYIHTGEWKKFKAACASNLSGPDCSTCECKIFNACGWDCLKCWQ